MRTSADKSAFRRRLIAVIAVAACVIGCSNALDYEVAKLTAGQRKTVDQVLTADQLKMLDDWIVRNSTAGRSVPPGVTVDQALRDQAGWLAKQKAAQAKAEQLKKQAQLVWAATQAKFATALAVSLVSKTNTFHEGEHQFVALEIGYTNKARKDIQAVDGVLKLSDTYGNSIIDINRSINRAIPAGQTVVDHDAGIAINQSTDSPLKLWDTDFDKLKSEFETHSITFKDGTSMSDRE
jgi:hypothetical protein